MGMFRRRWSSYIISGFVGKWLVVVKVPGTQSQCHEIITHFMNYEHFYKSFYKLSFCSSKSFSHHSHRLDYCSLKCDTPGALFAGAVLKSRRQGMHLYFCTMKQSSNCLLNRVKYVQCESNIKYNF